MSGAFGITGNCENMVMYSDEYISFEYDADFFASIERYDTPSEDSWGLRNYSVGTAMEVSEKSIEPIVSITISDTKSALESGLYPDGIEKYYNSNRDNENVSAICIGKNEIMTEVKDPGFIPTYAKLLYYDEGTFITAIRSESEELPEQSKFVKHIYDTISVADTYSVEGYTGPEDGYYHERIVSNVLLSEQAKNYANEAIRIINEYLTFEVDAATSQEELANLYDRAENYAEQSEYVHDTDVNSILFLAEYDFDGKSDTKLLKRVEELQMLCGDE